MNHVDNIVHLKPLKNIKAWKKVDISISTHSMVSYSIY